MKTDGGMDVWLQVFLISTLDADECSASRSGRFNSGEREPSVHFISSVQT
jgi:hypothetical protein